MRLRVLLLIVLRWFGVGLAGSLVFGQVQLLLDLTLAEGQLLIPVFVLERSADFAFEFFGALRPRLEASFASLAPALAQHLHSDGVRAVWTDFLAGKTSWSRPWSLYVLNEWCLRHLAA